MTKENSGPRSWTVSEALELHDFEVTLTKSAATYAEKGDIGGMASKLEKAAGLAFLQQALKEDPVQTLRIVNGNLDLAKAVDEVARIRSSNGEEGSRMVTEMVVQHVEQLRPYARSDVAREVYDELLRLGQAQRDKQAESPSTTSATVTPQQRDITVQSNK